MEDWLKNLADNEVPEDEEEVAWNSHRTILFIGELSSFIGSAVNENFKNNGFNVIFAKPDLSELMSVKDRAEIYLFYLTENVEELNEALVFIKDTCIQDEKRVFLIGYEPEIQEAENIIPSQVVSGTFDRPINVNAMVESITKMVVKEERQPKKKHILVVDDSGAALRLMKNLLEPKYKVSMVNSGMNAITFLAKNQPDLILLDYEMPVCSGPQALSMIRNEPTTSSLPVMFLTAKGDRDSVQKVLSLKPDGYILKSLPRDELLQAIDNFFEGNKGDKLG